MYDIVPSIIKKETELEKISYATRLGQTDPTKVKPRADYFVSYAWSTPWNVLLNSLTKDLLHNEDDGDVYIWLDAFCVNQHYNKTFTPDELVNVFGSAVKAIGKAVIFASPWTCPIHSRRSWCVLEAVTISKHKLDFRVVMSSKDSVSFRQHVFDQQIRDSFMTGLFSDVDVEKAEATRKEDQEAIL